MRVVVLLSTYQGEKFISEQLRSVLDQLPLDGRVLIRDDGSTDATVAYVERMADKRVQITRGANLGFVRSFFWLLTNSPEDAEMVMLCDQDDVWLPAKIERAWNALRTAGEGPVLYCSRLRLVDPELRDVGLSPDWARSPSFANALSENIVTGCTSAMNPSALRLLREQGEPALVHFHDWWMYLVVAAFGRVIYDREPTLLYRQHGGNAIGMGSGLGRYVAIVRFLRRWNWVHIMFRQVENFRNVHGARLPPAHRALLDRYFDPRDGAAIARLVLTPRRFRQSLLGEALFRLLLLANIVSGRGLMPIDQDSRHGSRMMKKPRSQHRRKRDE